MKRKFAAILLTVITVVSSLLSLSSCSDDKEPSGEDVYYSVTINFAGHRSDYVTTVKGGEGYNLPTVVISGVKILGYYRDRAYTRPFESGTVINSDTVIYAKTELLEGPVDRSELMKILDDGLDRASASGISYTVATISGSAEDGTSVTGQDFAISNYSIDFGGGQVFVILSRGYFDLYVFGDNEILDESYTKKKNPDAGTMAYSYTASIKYKTADGETYRLYYIFNDYNAVTAGTLKRVASDGTETTVYRISSVSYK